MAKLKKILVAYDGSPHSKTALGWAMLLGSKENAEVQVVKVFEPIIRNHDRNDDRGVRPAEQVAWAESADRKMMEDVKSFCEGCSKLKVHVEMLKGHVASTLLDYSQLKGFDLIVSGTKGHGTLGEMLVGSVTNSLVSLSKLPVLVVKEQEAPVRLQNILVAYDGSDFAKAALELAMDIAKSSGAKLLAVKVTDPLVIYSMAETDPAINMRSKLGGLYESEKDLLNGAVDIGERKGLKIETKFLSGGNIADSIIRCAGETNADMIVAGTLGHGLLEEILLGSVTRNLISVSKIPVLVTKK